MMYYKTGMNYIDKLDKFDIDSLPDLDAVVMGALELFAETELPQIDTNRFQRPLVVGSGNAETTGRILFTEQDAVFASESTYQSKLDSIKAIDGVVIISASGSKHATSIATAARAAELPVLLITNTANSPAEAELDPDNSKVAVFPKNREPYTYNTSTYLGMILAKTGEDPETIINFIQSKLSEINYDQFSEHNKYVLITPPRFAEIVPMLDVKFTELFGRRVARDIKTSEYMMHATTVVPADELFVSFGSENTIWGESSQRLNIPLPDNSDYGTMMAVGYYVIGQIQKRQPDYFKRSIVNYTQQISNKFEMDIQPIVPVSDI